MAQIIQATGHQTSSSTAFTNRFNSHGNQNLQQFYAPLPGSSSPAATNQQQQHRSARPPVPLFTQGIGNQQNTAKMDLQGNSSSESDSSNPRNSPNLDALGYEDFTAFEGGATTAYSSPGVPGYDVNVSSASSVSNLGTVSPQDLLIRDSFASAPNSSAITNLTSPSMYGESPEFHDNYEVSPNFGSNDFDSGSGGGDKWFSLFPEQNSTAESTAPAVDPPAVDQSPLEPSEELELAKATSQSRRKSSNSPPSGNHGRHSSVGGVNPRRRDKPLPPIIIDDPNDTVAMKRARNTLAARKSRQRKAERFDELEEKIAGLEKERDYWKERALNGTG